MPAFFFLQVSELRALLQGEDEEEEEEEGEREGGVKAPEEMMVFEADEEKQPAYEPPPNKEVSVGLCLCCVLTLSSVLFALWFVRVFRRVGVFVSTIVVGREVEVDVLSSRTDDC